MSKGWWCVTRSVPIKGGLYGRKTGFAYHPWACLWRRPLVSLVTVKRTLWICGALLCVGYVWAQQPNLLDWPNLARYRAENKALPPAGPDEKRIVFFGDSITDAWGRTVSAGEFFPGK